MDIDLIMRITAMLDEEKTYKIIKRQLADVQKKLQGQVRFDISMNEKKLKSESENVKKNISDLFRDQNIAVKLDLQKKDLQSNIDKFLKNNTRMTKELNSQFVALKKTIDKVDDTSDLSELEGKLSDLKKEAIDTGRIGEKLSNVFKGTAKMLSSLDIKGKIIKQVTASIEELKGLDTILTKIGKTGNLTKTQLKQLGDSAFETASTYGKKASDYLTEVQKMAGSGFTGKQGQAMAEQSLLAQAAGNMTAEVANNYILAMNAACKFNGEAKKLNEVIDGQNSISARNNISLSNMAAAMTEIGSAASGYHISIEELSAMIGTIGSITNLEGSVIGSSVNSILNNLQNTGSSEITDTLTAANVSMTELVNGSEQLRDPISILKELSTVYNQLGENDSLKGEILSNIGGDAQSEELDALLQNMETFDSMLTDYAQGSGSAIKTAMKSADGWEGSLNQLSNTWTDTVNNFANSDVIVSGINALNSLLEMVNKVTEILGPAGSIGLAGGIFAGIENVGRVKRFTLIQICRQ